MGCEERARLEQQVSVIRADYQAARQAVDSRIGVTSRKDFLNLTQTADQAFAALQRVQSLLDQHVHEHGCERSSETAAGCSETV